MSVERLDKLLCVSGKYSRAEARTLIRGGAVTVEGRSCVRPEEKFPDTAEIRVGEERMDTAPFAYWMLNKPAGYVSASKDELYPAVVRLLPEEARLRKLFCAGRLDADVTGLLLLTDDGAYAHRVTAPRAEIKKTYEVQLDTPIRPGDGEALAAGIVWSDGTEYRPAVLVPDPADPRTALVTVTEGKYHEVKRLMEARGHRVLAMRRLSVGGLRLPEDLPEGTARRLTTEDANLVFYKNTELNP